MTINLISIRKNKSANICIELVHFLFGWKELTRISNANQIDIGAVVMWLGEIHVIDVRTARRRRIFKSKCLTNTTNWYGSRSTTCRRQLGWTEWWKPNHPNCKWLLEMIENFENQIAHSNRMIQLKPFTNRLLNATEKVLQAAEQWNQKRDYERAYIFYTKYFNLIQICREKKSQFTKFEDECRKRLGTKDDINKRMDVLEHLHKILVAR